MDSTNKLNPFFGFIYTWTSGLGLLSPKFSFVISPFCLSLYKPFSNSFIPAHTHMCVCVFFNGSHSSRWPSPLESLSKHKCHLIQRGVSPFHVSTAAMTSLGRRKKNRAPSRHWASEIFQRPLDRDTLDKPKTALIEEKSSSLFCSNEIPFPPLTLFVIFLARDEPTRIGYLTALGHHHITYISLSFGECCFYLSRKINFFF